MTGRRTVEALLAHAGRTYAQEAGIRLRDTPALWQLLVLANLLSARISAEIAVAAARELFAEGGTTARGMAQLSRQECIDALGRGRYVRYDESTATRLGDNARLLLDEYDGDVRTLAARADGDVGRLRTLVQRFSGIGPVGADIFCREAQAVWGFVRPYLDDLALQGARKVGLPGDPHTLAELVDDDELARLAAALVRVARDDDLAATVKKAAG